MSAVLVAAKARVSLHACDATPSCSQFTCESRDGDTSGRAARVTALRLSTTRMQGSAIWSSTPDGDKRRRIRV